MADKFPVDLYFDEADPHDFDAILLPGGEVNSARIREITGGAADRQGHRGGRKAAGRDLPRRLAAGVGGAGAGQNPDQLSGLEQDIRNAGGNWVDREVVVDGNWVSSRKPGDIPAFNREMIEVFGQRMRDSVRGTPDEGAVGMASS